MAVYTPLSNAQIEGFLAQYDLGQLLDFEGIVQGVENTNYRLTTDQGLCILTVFEARIHREALEPIFDYIDHCRLHGLPCPEIYTNRQGGRVGELAGKPAALQSFLPGQGMEREDLMVDHLRQLGTMLATMHDINEGRQGSLGPGANGPDNWLYLIQATGRNALNQQAEGLFDGDFYDHCLTRLRNIRQSWPADLPVQPIHADLFPDNVFFDQGDLSGIIDFYFSYDGLPIYDLAVAIHAHCADESGQVDPHLLQAFYASYSAQRPLSKREKQAMAIMLEAAAIRFLATRAYDWVHVPDDARVVKKDPREYSAKMLKCADWLKDLL